MSASEKSPTFSSQPYKTYRKFLRKSEKYFYQGSHFVLRVMISSVNRSMVKRKLFVFCLQSHCPWAQNIFCVKRSFWIRIWFAIVVRFSAGCWQVIKWFLSILELSQNSTSRGEDSKTLSSQFVELLKSLLQRWWQFSVLLRRFILEGPKHSNTYAALLVSDNSLSEEVSLI